MIFPTYYPQYSSPTTPIDHMRSQQGSGTPTATALANLIGVKLPHKYAFNQAFLLTSNYSQLFPDGGRNTDITPFKISPL